jgi:hypothetical protein
MDQRYPVQYHATAIIFSLEDSCVSGRMASAIFVLLDFPNPIRRPHAGYNRMSNCGSPDLQLERLADCVSRMRDPLNAVRASSSHPHFLQNVGRESSHGSLHRRPRILRPMGRIHRHHSQFGDEMHAGLEKMS